MLPQDEASFSIGWPQRGSNHSSSPQNNAPYFLYPPLYRDVKDLLELDTPYLERYLITAGGLAGAAPGAQIGPLNPNQVHAQPCLGADRGRSQAGGGARCAASRCLCTRCSTALSESPGGDAPDPKPWASQRPCCSMRFF